MVATPAVQRVVWIVAAAFAVVVAQPAASAAATCNGQTPTSACNVDVHYNSGPISFYQGSRSCDFSNWEPPYEFLGIPADPAWIEISPTVDTSAYVITGPNFPSGQPDPVTITGTGYADDLCAGDDGATIDELGGDGVVLGNDDDDALFGSAGDDEIAGGGGDDDVYGGVGADYLAGDGGDDVIQAGPDTDADEIHCGSGTDIYIAGEFLSDDYTKDGSNADVPVRTSAGVNASFKTNSGCETVYAPGLPELVAIVHLVLF